MNKKCYISLGLCACLILGCAADAARSNHLPSYTIYAENHVVGYDYPSKGAFYEYRFTSYKEQIPDVETELNGLFEHNIPVLDAWYQHGSAMCVAPDGKKALNVIVMPRFIVRLEKKNSSILKLNYKAVEKPLKIFCGYQVNRYHIVNK